MTFDLVQDAFHIRMKINSNVFFKTVQRQPFRERRGAMGWRFAIAFDTFEEHPEIKMLRGPQ